MHRRLLVAQLIVFAVLVVLDVYFGIDKGFFWSVSWWDIPAHIVGGMGVGFLGAWLATIFGVRVSVFRIALFALGIGVCWEVFEYVTHTGGSAFMSYQLDTAKDLLDDVIGGTIAGLFVKYILA